MDAIHTNPQGVCVRARIRESVDGIDDGVCQQIPTDLDSHHTHSVGEDRRGGVCREGGGGLQTMIWHTHT